MHRRLGPAACAASTAAVIVAASHDGARSPISPSIQPPTSFTHPYRPWPAPLRPPRPRHPPLRRRRGDNNAGVRHVPPAPARRARPVRRPVPGTGTANPRPQREHPASRSIRPVPEPARARCRLRPQAIPRCSARQPALAPHPSATDRLAPPPARTSRSPASQNPALPRGHTVPRTCKRRPSPTRSRHHMSEPDTCGSRWVTPTVLGTVEIVAQAVSAGTSTVTRSSTVEKPCQCG